MFNSRERTFTLMGDVEQDTSLGKIITITALRDVAVKLFTRSGSSTVSNNIAITDSTHFALTKDKNIKPKQTLTDGTEIYQIDYVIPDGAETQLFLKKVN